MLSCAASSGCLVPVPLEQETTGSGRPAIVYGLESPPFGQLDKKSMESFSFTVQVDDQGVDDQLYARIFRPTTNGLFPIGDLGPLPSASDTMHPNRHIASFQTLPYCQIYNFSAATNITFIVSNFGFMSPDSETTAGLTAQDIWVLTCSN
jgi:hypothetical protein